MAVFYLILHFFFSNAQAFNWTEFNFGVGVYAYDNIRPNNKRIFLNHDPVVEPIPTFQVRFGPLFINRDGGGMALLYFEHIKILALLIYEGEPYKTYGMEERKRSFYAGGGMRFFDLEGIYYQDIQGRSHGNVLKIFYAPEFKVTQNFIFSPRPYVQFWSQKYVDYFFGVRPEEVDLSIDRTAYDGKRATNYGLLFRNVWTYHRMNYVFAVEAKFYDRRVYDSPTVIRKEEKRAVLGFMYKFH